MATAFTATLISTIFPRHDQKMKLKYFVQSHNHLRTSACLCISYSRCFGRTSSHQQYSSSSSLGDPPFPFRRLIYVISFLSIFHLCFLYNNASPLSSESTHLRVALALSWMYYLDWLAKMVLHDLPERDFWRVDVDLGTTSTSESKYELGHKGVASTSHIPEIMAQPYNWRKKLAWAVSLLASSRGVGWNFQVVWGLRERGRLVGRRRFVMEQIIRVVVLVVFSDFASTIMVMGRDHILVVENEGSIWLSWNKVLLVPLVAVGCCANLEAQYAGFNVAFMGLWLAEEKVGWERHFVKNEIHSDVC